MSDSERGQVADNFHFDSPVNTDDGSSTSGSAGESAARATPKGKRNRAPAKKGGGRAPKRQNPDRPEFEMHASVMGLNASNLAKYIGRDVETLMKKGKEEMTRYFPETQHVKNEFPIIKPQQENQLRDQVEKLRRESTPTSPITFGSICRKWDGVRVRTKFYPGGTRVSMYPKSKTIVNRLVNRAIPFRTVSDVVDKYGAVVDFEAVLAADPQRFGLDDTYQSSLLIDGRAYDLINKFDGLSRYHNFVEGGHEAFWGHVFKYLHDDDFVIKLADAGLEIFLYPIALVSLGVTKDTSGNELWLDAGQMFHVLNPEAKSDLLWALLHKRMATHQNLIPPLRVPLSIDAGRFKLQGEGSSACDAVSFDELKDFLRKRMGYTEGFVWTMRGESKTFSDWSGQMRDVRSGKIKQANVFKALAAEHQRYPNHVWFIVRSEYAKRPVVCARLTTDEASKLNIRIGCVNYLSAACFSLDHSCGYWKISGIKYALKDSDDVAKAIEKTLDWTVASWTPINALETEFQNMISRQPAKPQSQPFKIEEMEDMLKINRVSTIEQLVIRNREAMAVAVIGKRIIEIKGGKEVVRLVSAPESAPAPDPTPAKKLLDPTAALEEPGESSISVLGEESQHSSGGVSMDSDKPWDRRLSKEEKEEATKIPFEFTGAGANAAPFDMYGDDNEEEEEDAGEAEEEEYEDNCEEEEEEDVPVEQYPASLNVMESASLCPYGDITTYQPTKISSPAKSQGSAFGLSRQNATTLWSSAKSILSPAVKEKKDDEDDDDANSQQSSWAESQSHIVGCSLVPYGDCATTVSQDLAHKEEDPDPN